MKNINHSSPPRRLTAMAGRFAAVVSIGTALLPLAGIHSSQAGEIKIVSPSAYQDTEGEGATGENCCGPYRYQAVFPAEDFAALGNKPHWLVAITFRPDQSVTSPRTVHDPDDEIRLTTMPVAPPNLSLRLDDNLGSNFKHWYRAAVDSGLSALVGDREILFTKSFCTNSGLGLGRGRMGQKHYEASMHLVRPSQALLGYHSRPCLQRYQR